MTAVPSREDVRNVVVILAGSRTGSSFLFRALSSSADFISPTGEETPFYRLAGIGNFTGLSYSDAVIPPLSGEMLERAAYGLLADAGVRCDEGFPHDSFADSALTRLEIQWPGAVPPERKKEIRARILEKLSELPSGFSDWRGFHLALVRELRDAGLAVDSSPYTASGEHPAYLPLVEEPPYIVPEPRMPASRELLGEHPLLLKTSTNAYRIPVLRKLFPKARFRWIVLRRNPAATIGALMEGWLSSGFHSHDIRPHGILRIQGYSSSVPGGERYWKFDMPPGWHRYTESSLPDVCAFQWHSAYSAIENFRMETNDPLHVLYYEDLSREKECPQILKELMEFAGALPKQKALFRAKDPVAAVSVPAPGKWKKYRSEILPALENFEDGGLLRLAAEMRYAPGEIDEWP